MEKEEEEEEVEECSLSNPPKGRVMGTRISVTSRQNQDSNIIPMSLYYHSEVFHMGHHYGEDI